MPSLRRVAGTADAWRVTITLIATVVGLAGCRDRPAPSASSADSTGRRVLLVGVDAADWRALDPLIEKGKLPTFARLRRAGRTATLVATPPLVSPILWTTIATGRSPEDHGVLDFMVDLPTGGQAPVTAAERKVPALWDFFSAAGRSVAVVGWWATWPAEAVRGTMVSDRVAPQLIRPQATPDERSIWPAEAARHLQASVVRAERVPIDDLRAYAPVTPEEYRRAQEALRRSGSTLYQDRIAHLAAVVAGVRSYGAVAEALLREGPPDLLAVYFEAVDTVSHLFVRDAHGPAAIEQAYREADALLERLARASAPETIVIVCSDHGFQPSDAGVGEDPADLTGPATAWHRPYGVLAIADAAALVGTSTDPAISAAPNPPATTATPLDIAPTVLHAAGLPVGAEMPGRVVETLLPEDRARAPVRRTPSPPRPSLAPVNDTADAGSRARLQALGYIGASFTSLARQNLGEVLYRAGRLPDAERVLRGVVESQPQNLAAHLWLARALADQGRTREALRVYGQAVRLPGGASSALVTAVELAAVSGLAEEGRALIAGLSAREQAAPPAAVARAVLALAAGRVPEAETALRKAIAAEPTSFDALSRLLDLLIPRGRAKDTLPALRRAASLAGGSPRHMALLGEALLACGAAAEAEKALATALALAPDSAPLRIDLARAQLTQGRPEEARVTVEPAPVSPERSVLLGASFSMQGRWQDAAGHFQDALARGSPTPDRLNGLAWAQHKLGRDEEAVTLLRRSLEMEARQPRIRTLLAQIESRSVAR